MKRITFGKGVQVRPLGYDDPISFQAKAYARPRNTLPPAISGSGTIGAAQSRTPGIWIGSPTVTYAWFLDGQEVQQGGTYTPTILDSGKTLTILERAVMANGLAASSRSAGVVIP